MIPWKKLKIVWVRGNPESVCISNQHKGREGKDCFWRMRATRWQCTSRNGEKMAPLSRTCQNSSLNTKYLLYSRDRNADLKVFKYFKSCRKPWKNSILPTSNAWWLRFNLGWFWMCHLFDGRSLGGRAALSESSDSPAGGTLQGCMAASASFSSLFSPESISGTPVVSTPLLTTQTSICCLLSTPFSKFHRHS